jgi:cyclopropane fatty-acyl-phospholipid synthase-like methyltransferase
MFRFFVPWLWDRFQDVFGANAEKRRIYRDLIECKPGSRVLDFGCSTGITTVAFNDCHYLGVDIDSSSIEWAKHKYKKASNIRFECLNIFDLRDEAFDHILCAGTGHHIEENTLVNILLKMGSLLAPGGKIHFVDIVKAKENSLTMRCILALDRGKYIRTEPIYRDLFENISSLAIEESAVVNANEFYTKPTFSYFRLVPSEKSE